MARQSTFSSPLLLGFEDIERLLDRVNKTAHDSYPPYNIEAIGSERIRITLAVAGFEREALGVTIEDNELVVRGKQVEEGERSFLHRGIATRQFHRAFVLADGLEVEGASLVNGLLSISLKRLRPETVVRNVAIKCPSEVHEKGLAKPERSVSVLSVAGRRKSE
jgi:HSP20 family molecular chaperone IbpA